MEHTQQAEGLNEKDFSLKHDEGNENGMGALKMAISALITFGLLSAGAESISDGLDSISPDMINYDSIENVGTLDNGLSNIEPPQPSTPEFAPAPNTSTPDIDNNITLSGPSPMTPV